MTTTPITPSTSKVRRDVLGGKRGAGNDGIPRVRRPDPRNVKLDSTDSRLTNIAGLASFGAFVRDLGVDATLERELDRLKGDIRVVYPMHAQMRLLIDAQVVGETRVLGVEALAADPVFVHLAGGTIPSIDTLYRDLGRVDDEAITMLDELLAHHGLEGHRLDRHRDVHVDFDTTVEPVFGAHEGAVPGYNPRYHGRPCLHPFVTRIAETDTCIGAVLRRGDRGFGEEDVPLVRKVLARARKYLGPKQRLFGRMDAAADCGAILRAFQDEKVFYVVKARVTNDLAMCTADETHWRTVDWDADGKPVTQVTEVTFMRESWQTAGVNPRVIAVRTTEPRSGRQLLLWSDAEWTTKIYLTNSDDLPEDVGRRYEGRAGIEPLIAEWKNGWGIGEIPSWGFRANHAMLLLKLLSHNLMRRFVRALAPELVRWRIDWIRHALVRVAGLFVRSARQWTVRVMFGSKLLGLRKRE